MPLDAGTQLGPYEIVSPIGAGGMGEVYKARDRRLDRIVAVKVLPGAFAADPDGRWIAYQSDESGSFQIYVHPFPAIDTGRWQVSTNGGSHPLWSHDGRELFFIDQSGTLVASAVAGRETFTYGVPIALFPAGRYYVEVARNYDVSIDGTRFLFVKSLTDATRPSLMVVTHWLDAARAKMGPT